MATLNYSAFQRILTPSSERDSLLRKLHALPGDACSATVTDPPHLHGLVHRAALAYARKSGVAKAVANSLSIHVSDIVAERTGGDCRPGLAPRLGTDGFVSGLLHVQGAAHHAHWWQPHPAATSSGRDGTTMLEPGTMLLHHSSLRYHAVAASEDDDAAMWLRFLVWVLPAGTPGRQPSGPSLRVRDRLLVPFSSAALHAMPGGAHGGGDGGVSEATRLAALEVVLAATRGREKPPAGEATEPPPPAACADGHELGSWAAELPSEQLPAALLDAASVSAATLVGGERSPQLRLLGARAFRLAIGGRAAPQPSRGGAARVLVVLDDGRGSRSGGTAGSDSDDDDDNDDEAGSDAAAPLELAWVDPRPPSLRLEAFGRGARWPFAWGNRVSGPPLRNGAVLAAPATRSYTASLRRASVSAWIELSYGAETAEEPEDAEGEKEEEEEEEKEEQPMAATQLGAIETLRLHPTTVYVRHRLGGKGGGSKGGGSKGGGSKGGKATRTWLKRHAAQTPGVNYSNSGGWQSQPDLLMEAEPLAQTREEVRDAVLEYLAVAVALRPGPSEGSEGSESCEADAAEAAAPSGAAAEAQAQAEALGAASSLDVRFTGWAGLNRPGDSNALHEHVDQDWAVSGVHYLAHGGDARCALRFLRPWPGGSSGAPVSSREADEAVVDVADGMTIVFPSWLQHWVPPHCGTAARLAVAFNVAATVPGRVNPDGELHLADPHAPAQEALGAGLGAAAQRYRDASTAAAAVAPPPPSVLHLWPLTVHRTVARPSAATAAQLRRFAAPAARQSCDGGAAACCLRRWRVDLGAANGSAPLLAPVEALASAALGLAASQGGGSDLVLRACLLSVDGRVNEALREALPLNAHLAGLWFLPTLAPAAADTDSARADEAEERRPRLLLPDARDAAGNLASHMDAQRHSTRRHSSLQVGELRTAAGSMFAFPGWAPSYVQLPPRARSGPEQLLLAFSVQHAWGKLTFGTNVT